MTTCTDDTPRPVEPLVRSDGYYCVVCQRFIPKDEHGLIVHDKVHHPSDMTFDEEDKPQ